MFFMVVSHCTGAVTCCVSSDLITLGSECAAEFTLDITGFIGHGELQRVAGINSDAPKWPRKTELRVFVLVELTIRGGLISTVSRTP